jgi:hypothetical protein
MNKIVLYLLLIVVLAAVFYTLTAHTSGLQPLPNALTAQPTVATSSAVLGIQTKFDGCVVNGPMQDTSCSPGAIFPSATKEQICVSGYSKSVRNVPVSEKNQVYAEYGIKTHLSGEYEVDHIIPLELGGSNDIANLWPEAANPTPGFHQKDVVENYLHQQVCDGAISLQQAQLEIATDWVRVYSQIKGH